MGSAEATSGGKLCSIAGKTVCIGSRILTAGREATEMAATEHGDDPMPLAYWCILIAALLPIVWISYAKIGSSGDNHYPREDYVELTPPKRRAYAAHQNAYENFPFFAAAVLVAATMGAPISIVNVLAVLYILFRIIHGLLYIANKASLRSLAFAAAWLINVAIFVLPAFK